MKKTKKELIMEEAELAEQVELALLEYENFKKNRFISDEMIHKIKSILYRIGQYGPIDGEKQESIACAFCDMGEAGYSFRGDGFHDDNCAVKDAQLLYKEMFGEIAKVKV